jgi:hypothetical protein
MALKLPADFDVNTEHLDTNEIIIRDHLKVEVTNWAKFRHTINIGNNAANLHPLGGPIPISVQEAYRELAKSHYEVITSLGSAKLSLDLAFQASQTNSLLFKKSLKDFYFHLGCMLDNLARLIYILNDAKSATATNRPGRLIRHWIDWGSLQSYTGYVRLKRSKVLKEIINIRNAFTHGWSCPIAVTAEGVSLWPKALRTKRDFYWPYDEAQVMRQRYRTWFPILQGLRDDFAFIEEFQNCIFGKLIGSVHKFEKHYTLIIR